VWGDLCAIGASCKGRLQRVSLIPVRPGEGHLTEPTAAIQLAAPTGLHGPEPSSVITFANGERRVLGGHPTTSNSGIREDGTKR
jgi:hypothetical protein